MSENHFESNRKYYTIAIYTLVVIFLATIFILAIANWKATSASLRSFFRIISPFFGGLLIAFVLSPLQSRFFRLFCARFPKTKTKSLQKVFSILVSYILVFGLIFLGFFYIVPQIVTSIKEIIYVVPSAFRQVEGWINELNASYEWLDLSGIEEKMNELLPKLIQYGTNLAPDLLSYAYNFSMSLAKVVVNIFLAIVSSLYIVADRANLKRHAKRLIYAIFPKERSDDLCVTIKACAHIFTQYILGKAIDSLIIGILCFLAMTILRLPYALLLSVVVGVTNMIPYFGPFIGAVPGVLLYLVTSPLRAVIFAVMILCIQQLDGWFIGPKILGDSTGLKPLWIIVAITMGGAYFGVLGMFLGVPVFAVLGYLIDRYIIRRLKKKSLENESSLQLLEESHAQKKAARAILKSKKVKK